MLSQTRRPSLKHLLHQAHRGPFATIKTSAEIVLPQFEGQSTLLIQIVLLEPLNRLLAAVIAEIFLLRGALVGNLKTEALTHRVATSLPLQRHGQGQIRPCMLRRIPKIWLHPPLHRRSL